MLNHEGLGPTTAVHGNVTGGLFIAYLMEDLLPFRSPYSPELNPIEEAWSKLKQLLRKLSARSLDALLDGVVILAERISPQDAHGWMTHAGYSPP